MTAHDSEPAVAPEARRRGHADAWQRLKRHPAGPILVIYLVTLALCAIFGLIYPDTFAFLSKENVIVMFKAIPLLGIMSLGVGVLMISGEFDLSVGAVYTFGPMMMAIAFLDGTGWPLGLAMLLAVVAAAGVALINAFVTLRFEIPSFITTLGMLLVLRGGIRWVSDLQPQSFYPGDITENLLTGSISGVLSAQILWLIGFAVAAYVLLNRHRVGNQMFAVGGNKEAAIAVGIDVTRVKLIAFVVCAVAAAVSGIFTAIRVNSVSPVQGFTLELQAIAVCVVGGLFLFGGRGSILGIVLGAAFIYTIQDILLLIRAPGYYFEVFVGTIVIVAVALNTWLARRG